MADPDSMAALGLDVSPTDAPAPRTGLHAIVSIGLLLVGVVMLVTVAAWLLVRSPSLAPGRSLPLDRSVGWWLTGSGLDSTWAQTTTVIPVQVEVPACASRDGSWQATPSITYTPTSVTITMIASGDVGAPGSQAGDGEPCFLAWNGRLTIHTRLDEYVFASVDLSEPLGGRALFDGSGSSPRAVPYLIDLPAGKAARSRFAGS